MALRGLDPKGRQDEDQKATGTPDQSPMTILASPAGPEQVRELLDRARQYVQRWQDSEGIAYGSYSAALISELLSLVASLSALPAATQGWVMTLPFGESPLKQAAWDAFYATAESEIPKNPDGTHSGTFWVALMEGIKAYLSAAQPPAAPERE